MKAICYPFAGLAAIGLVLSLAIHLLALTGRIPLSGGYWFLMHVGVFVVMIPAVLVSQFTTRDFKQKDQLKASLRGCPRWVPRALQVLGAYAIFNFIRFIVVNDGHPKTEGDPDPSTLWGFSGHWMVFYASAWAMLYSAARTREVDRASQCPNGHLVNAMARYCEECGAAVTKSDVGQ